MQRLHHHLEFVHRVVGGRVARLRSEEADAVVTPVVDQSALDQNAIVDEAVHRQQLDRGDAERAQMVYGRRAAEAGIGTAQFRRNAAVERGESFHVQLVDECVAPAGPGLLDTLPVERGIDHPALRHRCRVVPPVEGQVRTRRPDLVSEMGVAPAQLADHGAGVGIEEKPVRVEAMSLLGSVWPLHAKSVQCSRRSIGQIPVPDEVGALGQARAHHLAATALVEDADLDGIGVLGEDGEVDAVAIPRRTERVGRAWPQGRGCHAFESLGSLVRSAGAHDMALLKLGSLAADRA